MGLMTEHYYTFEGRQRAVFLRPDTERAVFAVELQHGDEAAVEVTYDPPEMVRRGQGRWELFGGGPGDPLKVPVRCAWLWARLMAG